jgi:hypothetical protein
MILRKAKPFCEMCGSVTGDFWQTRPSRPVVLKIKPRFNDIFHAWTICDECFEGLLCLNRRDGVVRLQNNLRSNAEK